MDLTNRETWLTNSLERFVKPLFKEHSLGAPDARVSVGFPSRRAVSTRKRADGECWSCKATKDQVHQIFISPFIDDGTEALGILIHEYTHASVGTECGHKAPFKRAATAVGLTGKMTSTVLCPELAEQCRLYVESAGEYPHRALVLTEKEKRQGTRMLKAECPNCGYTIRTTQKWVDVGLPICVCGTEFQLTTPEDE